MTALVFGWHLPPGVTDADIEAAQAEGPPAVEPRQCKPGDCRPCFDEGFTTPALPGSDRCEECS